MTTETSAGSSVVSLAGNGLSYPQQQDEYRRKIINVQGETVSSVFWRNIIFHACNFFFKLETSVSLIMCGMIVHQQYTWLN
jgi:hypothetical protein